MAKKYRIERHYTNINKPSKIIKTGLTLQQAKEYCKREDSHKLGKWFDGYEEENYGKPKQK
jgi:hypothetical protein